MDTKHVFNLMTLEEDISLKLEKESDGVVLQLLRTELAQVRTDIDRAIACTTTTSAPQSPSRRLGRERRSEADEISILKAQAEELTRLIATETGDVM